MDLSVAEYARERGISRQRALAMINAGQIEARRVGRSWVIDQRELGKRAALGRPLSKHMARVLVDVISGLPLAELDPQDRYFAAKYVERLGRARTPAELLSSWLRARQITVVNLSANPADLADIRVDERIVPSGISDDRSGMSSARELEGYIAAEDQEAFANDNLLVESDSPNVRLHVVENLPPRPVPLGLVLADLADWNRAREDGRVGEILEAEPWNR